MSREALLRVRTRAVQVNGEAFHVRALTGTQLEAMQDGGDGTLAGLRAVSRVVLYCACDESGQRLFTDDEIDMVHGLGMDVLKPLSDAALSLSGLGDDSGND